MRRARRTAIAAGVAGSVLGAGALGAWLVAPGAVRDEAIARIERRTGLRCRIDDVDAGFTRTVLRRVRLSDDAGAIDVELEGIELDAGLPALAAGGADAVTTVTIRGGRVSLDLARYAVPEDEAGARPDEGAPGSTGATIPRVIVTGLAATLRDEHGELVAAGSVDADLEGDRLVLDVRDLAIAPGSTESVRAEALHVEAGPRRARVDAVRVAGARVEIADAPTDVPGIVTRARAARRRLVRGGREDAAVEAEGTGGPLRWLGDRFSAQIDGATVRRGTPDGARDVLTELSASLERASETTIRTRGEGTPDGGGELAWDLRVDPGALRAEGSIDLEEVAVAVLEPILPSELPLHRPDEARISGSLRVEGQGEALHGTGRLAVRDLALAHPRIAPDPVRGISFALDGEASFRPVERRLEIASLRIESGAAHADVRGAIEWAADHYRFDLEATLPPTACNDAIGAIPRDLLQELAVLSMGGRIGGRIQVRIDSRDLDATQLVIRVADGCRFELVPPIADLSRFEAPFVHRVEEPDGTIFEMETGPGTDSWAPIAQISPFMVHAALGHEDGGFFGHEGFSTYAIREALVRNLREGRYVMGASTISMQLVKNVFLRREKTLARKVQEVLLTWWIESAWPKERILELYLNVIEYGPSVYGIRNASRHYFGVEPADLSPAQAAYLASILPSPKAYHEHYEQGSVPASWVARVTRFIRLLGERGRYDAAAVQEGVDEMESLRFHREGETLPAVRSFQGRTAPLPYASASLDLVDAQWEAVGGDEAGGEVDARPPEEYE